MAKKQEFRKFKPYIMRYLHSHDPNFEPVLRDLLDHERYVYQELSKQGEEFTRGERSAKGWEIVFGELAEILTPNQVLQLLTRLREDFEKTCETLQHMAEGEKTLIGDQGGES